MNEERKRVLDEFRLDENDDRHDNNPGLGKHDTLVDIRDRRRRSSRAEN